MQLVMFMKRVIWTSSLDLSKEGVDRFCRDCASRYGKTAEELHALTLLDLASSYMLNERRRLRLEISAMLAVQSDLPILVIADKADFGNRSHRECSVLAGDRLSEILECREGLSTTFYSDGHDIRCEDITEHGTNFYLFREVTNLKGLHSFISMVQRGDPFTESQLDQYTRSVAPQVHQLLGWSDGAKLPLESQVANAQERKSSMNINEQPVPLER